MLLQLVSRLRSVRQLRPRCSSSTAESDRLASASQRRGVTPLVTLVKQPGKIFRKVGKQRLHHQIRVPFRYTVNFVAHNNRQPGHTHTTTVGFINDRRPYQQIGIVRILFLQGFQEIVVDFKDDLQVTRQNFTRRAGPARFPAPRSSACG